MHCTLVTCFDVEQHFFRVIRLRRGIHSLRYLFMRGTPFAGYLSNCVNTHGNAVCIGPGQGPFFIDLRHPLLQFGLQAAYLRQVLVQNSCLFMAQCLQEPLMILDHVSDGGLELLLLDGKDFGVVQPMSIPIDDPASQFAHNVRRRHAIGKRHPLLICGICQKTLRWDLGRRIMQATLYAGMRSGVSRLRKYQCASREQKIQSKLFHTPSHGTSQPSMMLVPCSRSILHDANPFKPPVRRPAALRALKELRESFSPGRGATSECRSTHLLS